MRDQISVYKFLKDLSEVLNKHNIYLDNECLVIDKDNNNDPIGYLEGNDNEIYIINHEDEISVISNCSIEVDK